jgi:hypothetical protein
MWIACKRHRERALRRGRKGSYLSLRTPARHYRGEAGEAKRPRHDRCSPGRAKQSWFSMNEIATKSVEANSAPGACSARIEGIIRTDILQFLYFARKHLQRGCPACIDRTLPLDYTRTVLPEWRNWQTRTTQNRVPLGGMRVRFPPSALARNAGSPYSFQDVGVGGPSAASRFLPLSRDAESLRLAAHPFGGRNP